ncbi:MAG: hypothetical protein ABGY09_03530 [Euryarchaeota archaeon]
MSVRCYRVFGGPSDPGRIRRLRVAVSVGVTLFALAAAVELGWLANWYLGAAVFLLVFGALPVPVHLLCSHVRVEPERVVIVRDFGFFRREMEIPRRLIEGAEAVSRGVRTREGEVRWVRVYLRGRGCLPVMVRDAEGLARELGGPP